MRSIDGSEGAEQAMAEYYEITNGSDKQNRQSQSIELPTIISQDNSSVGYSSSNYHLRDSFAAQNYDPNKNNNDTYKLIRDESLIQS